MFTYTNWGGALLWGSIGPERPDSRNKKSCLKENEKAEYELVDKKQSEDSAIIVVKNRELTKEKQRFSVPLSSATHYHPIELHNCGVYVVRRFNYDYIQSGKKAFLPGFKKELWRYKYDGYGEDILLLSELGESGDYRFPFYNDDFRIDPNERYLVLEKGFAGSSDDIYDIVFKYLETIKDAFVLPVSEVWKKYPNTVPGSSVGFYPGGWTKDGRYFWVNFFGGAPVFAYMRINTRDWSYDVYIAPPDVLGGDQLNIENGWITIHLKNE